jgi:hypothetical protein
MNPDEISPEAEALDKFLNGQPEAAGDLPPGEAGLAERLLAAAGRDQAGAQFAARLESRLLQAAGDHRRRPFQAALTNLRRPIMIRKIALPLAGAAALVILALFVLPLLTHHPALPSPASPQASQAPSIAPIATLPAVSPTMTQPALPLLPFLDVLTAQAAGQSNGGIFANAQWTLNTTLPDGPDRATVYSQVPGDLLTPAAALQMAEKLGIQGQVYQSEGEMMGQKTYTVTDGGSRMWMYGSPASFTYMANYAAQPGSTNPLPFEKQAAIAEAFLKEHGLLDFDYKIEPVKLRPDEVSFTRVLDGRVVHEDNPFDPRIDVTVSDSGEVETVIYRVVDFKPTGEYPIRSAQAAWEELLSGKLNGQVSYAVSDIHQPGRQRTWSRQYPSGQPLDLYGYVELLKPVDPQAAPLVTFNGYPLSGDGMKGIDQVAAGTFLHTRGELQKNENGVTWLQVQGWEETSLADDNLSGKIKLEGGSAYLLTNDGKALKLLAPPADLEDGLPVDVRGVQLDQPVPAFDWSSIQAIEGCFDVRFIFSAPGGGGGGGGGGGNCPPEQSASSSIVNSIVSGPPAGQPGPTPEPVPVPYQPGDAVDGLTGTLNVVIFEQPDGSRTTQTTLFVSANAQFPQAVGFNLLGDALKGSEALNNLDVRVWGKYSEENGQPAIQVERYAPAFPGQKIQAWLGIPALETVNGRKVVLFTSQDGTQYVLKSSLDQPEEQVQVGFPAGKNIVIEGVLEGEQTFGGYPLLRELMASYDPKRKDLKDYKITANQPPVVGPQSGPGDLIKGQVNVDKVELVYYAADLSHGWPPPAAGDPARSVQPLWSFSGSLEDGRTFEVLVQAVENEYLK